MKNLIIAVFIQFILLGICNLNSKENEVNFMNSTSHFIENKGQWPDNVKFLAISKNYRTWITENSFIFDVDFNNENNPDNPNITNTFNRDISELLIVNSSLKHFNTFNKKDIQLNFCKSNNKIIKDVNIYDSIYFSNIYDGIDLRLNFDDNNLRYDFVINKNVDPKNIQLEPSKNLKLKLLGNDLLGSTENILIKHTDLKAYQNLNNSKGLIDANFKLIKNKLTFDVKSHNPNEKLIIDPIILIDDAHLGFSTHSEIKDIETRGFPKKTIFVGSTFSTDFPNSFGTIAGDKDGVFGEMEINQNNVINTPWVTFYGGVDWDIITSVDLVTNDNKIYFTGYTNSPDLPITTQTAYYDQIIGIPTEERSNFFTVYSDDGTNLLYSTYLKNQAAANVEDSPNLEVSDDGKIVYLSGIARLNALIPFTEYNEIQTQDNSNADPYYHSFIMAFDLDLNSSPLMYNLKFASLFGGNYFTIIKDIVVDQSNNIYICGVTKSNKNTFFTTSGAYDEINPNNLHRGFVSKLKYNGSNLQILYNTFFATMGGSYTGFNSYLLKDDVSAIEYVNNKVYIAGSTSLQNGIPTLNAFDDTYNNNNKGEAFISAFELNGNGANDLVYSSFFGGTEDSRILDLDYRPVCGYVYFTGLTYSELTGYKGILNSQHYNHDIMVGAIDINKTNEYTLTELAYYPNYTKNIIGKAIDGGTYGDNYVYFGGTKSNGSNGDALLGAYSVTSCITPPYCECTPYFKNKLLSFDIEKSGGSCEETECLIRHNFGPELNAYCYTHVEYSATLDGNLIVPPSIHPLNPNMTFPISQYDICIPRGAKYEVTIKLLEGLDDLAPCIFTKVAYCPVADPSSYCVPDCEDDEFESRLDLFIDLPICPDCKLSVQYSSRIACNGNYDIRIDALEVVNNNPLNPYACSLCNFSSNFELAIKEIISRNEMGFEPVTSQDPCSNIYRIIESSCWSEFYYIIDAPIIIGEDPEINKVTLSYVPCVSNCCGISLTVCRLEYDKVHITNNGPIIFDELNCEGATFEPPVDPIDPFLLEHTGMSILPCSPRCDNFVEFHTGIHVSLKSNPIRIFDDKQSTNFSKSTFEFNNDILNIQLNLEHSKKVKLEIFDIQGKKVIELEIEAIDPVFEIKENCSNLNIGSYYFKISHQGSIIYSNKFIKVK